MEAENDMRCQGDMSMKRIMAFLLTLLLLVQNGPLFRYAVLPEDGWVEHGGFLSLEDFRDRAAYDAARKMMWAGYTAELVNLGVIRKEECFYMDLSDFTSGQKYMVRDILVNPDSYEWIGELDGDLGWDTGSYKLFLVRDYTGLLR